MTKTFRIAAIGAVLFAAACSDPTRFDDTNTVDLNNQPTPSDVAPLDPASDPASPAYFQAQVGDRVLFLVDEFTLTSEAKAVLDGQAEWLILNSDYQALVEGHADEQGTTEYNLALSARRANAVKEYLASKGVSQSRMRTVPYGKERPAELCANESCYAQNRRAVTVIAAGALTS
ncbi:peptidoglycan-associated lipoprotein Pal [Shimia ponticola]|uniref:peptidoglycan-associated lipoprotein Pal n=1 Tax=Shimia ponticola TaxID=2582893 RepID=UPI0011BE310F|nr:peptidoglycan-associated lipoprotein Pal [Shimia ponticola]